MSVFLRKYATGTGADVIIPMIKRGAVDFAATADWTPAAGDVKVSIDGGAEANIGTLPVINGTYGWKFVFSNAELTGKSIRVTIVDSATKAVEDQMFLIETYGNASAMYQADLSAANLPANMVQIAADTQSATDLKDFADTGYDPATHKVQGVVLTDTVTTYTGNTPQTGDSYALANGASGFVATKADTAAIKAKTDNLPSDPADASDIAAEFAAIQSHGDLTWSTATGFAIAGDAMTLTSGERDAIAAALLDLANGIETGLTLRNAQRLQTAAAAGKLSGAATTTVLIRNAVADSKNRISATVDADGNRSAVTLDLT